MATPITDNIVVLGYNTLNQSDRGAVRVYEEDGEALYATMFGGVGGNTTTDANKGIVVTYNGITSGSAHQLLYKYDSSGELSASYNENNSTVSTNFS